MSTRDRKRKKLYNHYSNIMVNMHDEDIDLHKPIGNPPAYAAEIPQTFLDNYRHYKELANTREHTIQKLETENQILLDIIKSVKAELKNKKEVFETQAQNHTTEVLLLKTEMVSMLQGLRDNVERGALYIKKHNIDFNDMIETISAY